MISGKKFCIAACVLACSAIIPAGCTPLGYTAKSQYRTGVTSVCVPIWSRGTDVYRRGVEMRLTEALQKRIELDTPYKVTGQERADTLLVGTIRSISQKTLSMNPDTGFPREIRVRFTVSFRWEDLRTGKNIMNVERFTAAEVYHPTPPYNEEFFRGSQGAIEVLARRIVEKMAADW